MTGAKPQRDMKYYFTVEDFVQAVQDSSGPNANLRAQISRRYAVKHMHAFIKEAKPTMDEWI